MNPTHNIDRVDELNERITNRLEPNPNLQPNFDPRPISTKYSLFRIVDPRPMVQVNKKATLGMNIDVENTIRGQQQRLQSRDSGEKYIPDLGSDMYTGFRPSNTSVPVEHALLFTKHKFEHTLHPNLISMSIGKDQFHNHTRTQLRNTP